MTFTTATWPFFHWPTEQALRWLHRGWLTSTGHADLFTLLATMSSALDALRWTFKGSMHHLFIDFLVPSLQIPLVPSLWPSTQNISNSPIIKVGICLLASPTLNINRQQSILLKVLPSGRLSFAIVLGQSWLGL